jgi:hypothetical protein
LNGPVGVISIEVITVIKFMEMYPKSLAKVFPGLRFGLVLVFKDTTIPEVPQAINENLG